MGQCRSQDSERHGCGLGSGDTEPCVRCLCGTAITLRPTLRVGWSLISPRTPGWKHAQPAPLRPANALQGST